MSSSKSRLHTFVLVFARIALGYLFLTQLFWKMPPSFGCPDDFAFTTGTVEDGRLHLQRTSGLCDWVGIESAYAAQPRPWLTVDMTPVGGPKLSLGLGWLAQLRAGLAGPIEWGVYRQCCHPWYPVYGLDYLVIGGLYRRKPYPGVVYPAGWTGCHRDLGPIDGRPGGDSQPLRVGVVLQSDGRPITGNIRDRARGYFWPG